MTLWFIVGPSPLNHIEWIAKEYFSFSKYNIYMLHGLRPKFKKVQ
jgi:hypothetical protein